MTALSQQVPQQRMRALEQANAVRLGRAAVKHNIADGSASVRTVLLDPPECVEGMSVGELLRCQRGWGRAKVLTACSRSGVPSVTLVRNLPVLWRERLLAALSGRRS